MGVTGDLLNRVLKTAARDIDLRHYSRGIEDYSTNETRPLRVGIDVSGWIARATHGHGSMLLDERHLTNFGRAQMLLNNQDPSEFTSAQNRANYVQVCAKYVLDCILVLQNTTKAQLLVVFDGKSPPLKQKENARRCAKKKTAVEQRETQGIENSVRLKAAQRTGAGSSYANIIVELMISLRIQKIAFLVSPYEADGQLAFLSECGMVDLVLTEDSDLIAHGVRSILFKESGGRGKLIQRRDLGAMELIPKSLSLMDFSDCMLAVLFACVGCDYCTSLRMIGSVTAKEVVENAFHSSRNDSRPPLVKVFEQLYSRSNQILTTQEKEDYESCFLAAVLMFRHPVVFDPVRAKCVLFRNPPFGSDFELMEYEPYRQLCSDQRKQEEILGKFFPLELQSMIAEGYVDPRTLRLFPNMATPSELYATWKAWNDKNTIPHSNLPLEQIPEMPLQQQPNETHQHALDDNQDEGNNDDMNDDDDENMNEGDNDDINEGDDENMNEGDDKGLETQDQEVAMCPETQEMYPLESQEGISQDIDENVDDSEYPASQGPQTQDVDPLMTESNELFLLQQSQASNGSAATNQQQERQQGEEQTSHRNLTQDSMNDLGEDAITPHPESSLTGSQSSDHPSTQSSQVIIDLNAS